MEYDKEGRSKEEEVKMSIRFFTDGACSGNPGPGGWAIVKLDNESVQCFSGGEVETTNNRMELKAVVTAMRNISKLDEKEKYEIHSDSAYVVNAIKNEWIKRWQLNGWKTSRKEEVKNQDLWKELLELQKGLKSLGFKVKFVKVKGHSGNMFNEMADKLAKEETQKYQQDLESNVN